MSTRQLRIPRTGTAGTKGARKGRSISGCVRRITSTAAQTIRNARSVRMLTSVRRKVMGRKAASAATKLPVRSGELQGVRKTSWMEGEKGYGRGEAGGTART